MRLTVTVTGLMAQLIKALEPRLYFDLFLLGSPYFLIFITLCGVNDYK